MKCLVALDFSSCKGKKPNEDQIKMSEVAVKIPVLNNMALALNKQGHTQRALDMLDQVVDLDEFNEKAWSRRLNYLV